MGRLNADVEAALAAHGLEREPVQMRVTGCPNGCTRPYGGEIGIVGRTANDYALFLGGDFEGTRLNRLVFDRVALGRIAPTLEPLFAAFAADRAGGEGFGDWCARQTDEALRALAGAVEARAA